MINDLHVDRNRYTCVNIKKIGLGDGNLGAWCILMRVASAGTVLKHAAEDGKEKRTWASPGLESPPSLVLIAELPSPVLCMGAKDQRESKRRGKWRKEQDGHRGAKREGNTTTGSNNLPCLMWCWTQQSKSDGSGANHCGRNKELGP